MTGEKQGKKQEDPKPAGPQDADTKAKEKKPAGRPKSSAAPSKRKAEAPSASAPSKAARRSSRTIPTTARSAVDILKLLLSPDSLALTRPKDEASSLSENDAKVRTYSESEFTAFEELMSAVILSRPISHVLGVRSIRTVLNPPYEFSTPEKLKEAGVEGVRKALDVAKTQHRQKTAEELVGLAEAVMGAIAKGKGSWEEAVRGKSKEDFDEARDLLSKNIKGIGKTGLNIFFRRIQGAWPEIYPFVDERTELSLERVGLPSDADKLRDLLQDQWTELKGADLQGKDDEEKQRKAFVRILERTIGADLEGNVNNIKSQGKEETKKEAKNEEENTAEKS